MLDAARESMRLHPDEDAALVLVPTDAERKIVIQANKKGELFVSDSPGLLEKAFKPFAHWFLGEAVTGFKNLRNATIAITQLWRVEKLKIDLGRQISQISKKFALEITRLKDVGSLRTQGKSIFIVGKEFIRRSFTFVAVYAETSKDMWAGFKPAFNKSMNPRNLSIKRLFIDTSNMSKGTFVKTLKGGGAIGTAITLLWNGSEFYAKGEYEADDWRDFAQNTAVDLAGVAITSVAIAVLALGTGGVGLFILGAGVSIAYGMWDPLKAFRPKENTE